MKSRSQISSDSMRQPESISNFKIPAIPSQLLKNIGGTPANKGAFNSRKKREKEELNRKSTRNEISEEAEDAVDDPEWGI